ncbi:MAG: hypothetical protein H7061_03525 [Bdellovibrionaceae bacterium]|nr:hypothetical protein [Bdellovibrio sp.]
MKKMIITTVLTLITAHSALAADYFCAATVESKPGSQQYDKILFWEKADTSKVMSFYVLNDGTAIKGESLSPEQYAKMADGTLAIFISFADNKTNLFTGHTKHNADKGLTFVDLAATSAPINSEVMLIGNNVFVGCR